VSEEEPPRRPYTVWFVLVLVAITVLLVLANRLRDRVG
jgi:hypothetical protein